MSRPAALVLIVASLFLSVLLFARRAPSQAPTPIVVELFTSEGCSTCPPADALLQKFDQQPFPGVQLIVLSEHVDYWNHIGWRDPYSSAAFSQRQNSYGTKFRLDSVYTPQMVVDGAEELAGSGAEYFRKAFEKVASETKVPMRISMVSAQNGLLKAHVETDELPAKFSAADVLLAVALDHAESQVKGGENDGRHLTHVAVARSLSKVGTLANGKSFASDVEVKLEPGTEGSTLRVIAFLQQRGPGKIVGAAEEMLGK